MSPTMLAQQPQPGMTSPAPRESSPQPRRPIVTRAEASECTCPDACERDHELD